MKAERLQLSWLDRAENDEGLEVHGCLKTSILKQKAVWRPPAKTLRPIRKRKKPVIQG